MPADVILYAVVAAGLVFWLRSLLGTRHGEERERPNPYNKPEEPAEKKMQDQPYLTDQGGEEAAVHSITQLKQISEGIYSIENKTAENNLLEIAERDPNFDLPFFMHASRDVFTMVVQAFAEDDRETLRDLLSPDVYEAFETSITERRQAGETLETIIHGIRKAEITEAMLDGSKAYITVRFTADETRVHRDQDGGILSGDPDAQTEIIDIWTFGRDLESDDPRWLVVQTRSDDPDDNEIIPNTD